MAGRLTGGQAANFSNARKQALPARDNVRRQCADRGDVKENEAAGDLLLFRARRGGPIRESRYVQDHFKPLLRLAELPAIRLYDLRHIRREVTVISVRWAPWLGRVISHLGILLMPVQRLHRGVYI